MSADETVTVYREPLDEGSAFYGYELEIEVDCWIHPEERQTRHYPGCPAHVEDYVPTKVRAVGNGHAGLWHNLDKFIDTYGFDIEFEPEVLMELCKDKLEPEPV